MQESHVRDIDPVSGRSPHVNIASVVERDRRLGRKVMGVDREGSNDTIWRVCVVGRGRPVAKHPSGTSPFDGLCSGKHSRHCTVHIGLNTVCCRWWG